MELVVESPDVTLTTPIYDVTRIHLVSARVPNSQQLINGYNRDWFLDGNQYSIDRGNYDTGAALADALNKSVGPSAAVASFDPVANQISFTGTVTMNDWLATIVGFPNGRVDLTGPRYITVRVTVGGDVLAQKVSVKEEDCHHLGKMLTGPIGRVIEFTDAFDQLSMSVRIHSLEKLRVEFLNPDGTPYDFGGSPWVLKFRITGTLDKLSAADRGEGEPAQGGFPGVPKFLREPENQRFIVMFVIAGLVVGLLMLLL